ncbi:mannitol dehydrogenase family protein [Planctomonas sp. JC2975]|uniref:mannitol dehydrogenase family protein n=1 Tax=Planctomonas sp. JC2975 TaxID=2729626 RepID=UPI001474891F|nr:mannitol dehydrogenase family protein [Planctomonas sp. JC2975]NNC11328.1 mannitol dehydrogenase family protein [Planctomonas sp. JC2975]
MPSVADARSSRPEVRMAHLGLGYFHRAHQAWYTERANALPPADRDAWGIAAFTGRSPRTAAALAAQDCVYTLITRAAEGDSAELVQSIVRAHDGAGSDWERTVADPSVALVTVTVTERAYETAEEQSGHAEPADETAGARIVRGLAARAQASAGPIALVSCDNLTGNGEALRLAVHREVHDGALAEWIAQNVSFVSTMVDRITPHTTDADRDTARELTGYDDAVPVVTEPFSEWIIQGDFPAGRPAWELVGARFVDDIEPYERRKLWLLNAGHTLLAATGIPRGHETVAEAFADKECRMLLEDLWAEARVLLPFDEATTDAALSALRTRFANPRIAHRLVQIDDGSQQKLRQRQAAIITARLDAGDEPGRASLATIEEWGRVRGLDLAEALDVLQPGLARRAYLG